MWEKGADIIRGVKTRFTLDLKVGDHLKAPELKGASVKEVVSDAEMIVTAPFMTSSAEPVPFQVAPKVDQSEVFESVSDALKSGGTIAVFPEGGSHDRTDLLPLKPGVAIMAISSILEGAEDVMIVPVGFSYFDPHKVLSRATVEIGKPIEISQEVVEEYKEDRTSAIRKCMKEIEQGLRNVIISARDYQTLKSIRLCTTLFMPERVRTSTQSEHLLFHMFSRLIGSNSESDSIVSLKRDLGEYALMLKSYGIPDGEVWQLKRSVESAIIDLVGKVVRLCVYSIIGVSMMPVWGPLRMASSWLAEKQRTSALAKSDVKILGKDVVASHKIVVVMILMPCISLLLGLMAVATVKPGIFGSLLIMLFSVAVMPFLSHYSHKRFAQIVPMCLHIRTLTLSIFSKVNLWGDVEKELITKRISMQLRVRKVVEEMATDAEKQEFDGVIARACLEADTRRLQRSKADFTPIIGRSYFESREEII